MYQKITKFCIYALVALLPLFWLPFTFEAFEFNKGYLLFFLVAIGLLAWLAKMIFKEKQIVFQHSRLDFAVLGFAIIMILATVFSKDKAASIYGFYGRFWPSLIGTLSLAGLYFLLTNNVAGTVILREPKATEGSRGSSHPERSEGSRGKQRDSSAASPPQNDKLVNPGVLLKIFLISAGLVVLVSYLSVFGVWQMLEERLPLVMASRAFNPVAGSLEGLSVFLAFLLVLLVGLFAFGSPCLTPDVKHTTSGVKGGKTMVGQARNIPNYLLLLAGLGLLGIVDFWPAWFVLATSLFLFLFFAFWKRLFKEDVNRLTLPILLFILALIFVVANPLADLLSQTPLAKLPAEVFLRQTASWRLVWECLKANPVLGSGLGNFAYAFSKFRPLSFLQDNPFWYLRLDRAGNHMAELVATTGVLGTLAYLGLIGLFFLLGFRAVILREPKATEESYGKQRDSSLLLRMTKEIPLLFAFLALLIAQFVYYQNTTLAFCFWLMLGLAATCLTPEVKGSTTSGVKQAKTFSFKSFPEIGLVFSIIFWVILAGFGFFSFKLAQNYRADVYYRQYSTNPFGNLESLKKAAQISSNSSVYHIVLARAYLASFSEELQKTQPDPQTLNNMVALAVGESRKAAEISPHQVTTYETSGIIYREIQGVAQGAIDWAIKSFERAIELEPKNPVLLTELGKLYLASNQKDKAIELFEQAIALKGDYADAYLEMSRIDEAEEKIDEAIGRLETLVARNPVSVEAHFQLGRLYYNSGGLEKAEEQFLAALRLFPNHSNSLYSLGLLYERQNRISEALELFERVLGLNPGNEDILAKIRALKE